MVLKMVRDKGMDKETVLVRTMDKETEMVRAMGKGTEMVRDKGMDKETVLVRDKGMDRAMDKEMDKVGEPAAAIPSMIMSVYQMRLQTVEISQETPLIMSLPNIFVPRTD